MGTLPVETMKARLQKLHEHLAALNVEGESGAGLVKITVNGKFDALRVNIDPSLIKPEAAEKLGNDRRRLSKRQVENRGDRAGQDTGAERQPPATPRSEAILIAAVQDALERSRRRRVSILLKPADRGAP